MGQGEGRLGEGRRPHHQDRERLPRGYGLLALEVDPERNAPGPPAAHGQGVASESRDRQGLLPVVHRDRADGRSLCVGARLADGQGLTIL